MWALRDEAQRAAVVPQRARWAALSEAAAVVLGRKARRRATFEKRAASGSDAREFGSPLDETEACLRDVAPRRTKILYQYDFGDSWTHVIVFEKIIKDAETTPPSCIDGARACPPEDSGGPWGYSEKLEALADPDDEESDELHDWMGEDFDPERFEKDAVNRQLLAVFRPETKRKKRVRRAK